MDKWIGKYCIVTGSSSGIGEKITARLARNGINVIGLARRPELIEENIEKIGEVPGRIYARYCDVSDIESVKEAFKWIENNFNGINMLINNAGTGMNHGMLLDDDETTDIINRIINTNLTGLVHCTRKSIALMKKNSDPSIIINISSLLGHSNPFLNIHFNIYPSTKFAVRAFTEASRQELMMSGNGNIRMCSISPGLVETKMTIDKAFENTPKMDPEDIADAAFYILGTSTNVTISDILMRPNFSPM